MTRRAWLMLAWGILILTIVDGTNFFNIPPYSVNDNSQSSSEASYEHVGFDGPVLSILIKLIDSVEGFVDRHETLFIVLSTIAIAVFTGTLYRATSGLLEAAEQQKSDMRESLRIANASAKAALIQANVLTSSERGYIKMSHFAPGLIPLDNSTDAFEIRIEIKNWGRTPCQVTDMVLSPVILNNGESLPKEPIYKRAVEQNPVHANLVSGESFFYTGSPIFKAGETMKSVNDGTKILYMIGYVDYSDKFGIKRRGGYARQYKPGSTDNNLVLVTQENYNYDRNRKEGEELPA